MPCFGVTTLTTHFSNELLDDILHRVRPLIGSGKVADYIPALAEVSPDRLGIAVCTVDGEIFLPVMRISAFRCSPFPKC